MSCSISFKCVNATWHTLLWFNVIDTGTSSNFKIKHSNCEEIIKEYIFYQVGIIVLYSSFQQNNFILFFPPISAVKYTLMTMAEFTKITICQATA